MTSTVMESTMCIDLLLSITLRQAQGDRVVGAALCGRPEEGKHIGLPLPYLQPFVLSLSKHGFFSMPLPQ